MSVVDLKVSGEIARRICSIVGVESNLVTNVHIEMAAYDLTRIKIERLVTGDELKHIVDVFEAVEWRPQPKVAEG